MNNNTKQTEKAEESNKSEYQEHLEKLKSFGKLYQDMINFPDRIGLYDWMKFGSELSMFVRTNCLAADLMENVEELRTKIREKLAEAKEQENLAEPESHIIPIGKNEF